MKLKKFAQNNGLAIVMFGIFAMSIIGMSIAGWHANNQTLDDHDQPTVSYVSYLGSGEFIEGVFENWESEFLAVGTLLILSIKLRERGSPQSKPVGKHYDHKTGS